ncbi:MAG: MFS transporter [Tatlockia sp.]|jgi:MFS family permease
MGSSLSYLLKKKTFLPLFLTQFFGAFNDNAFKLSMLTLISYHLSTTQAQSEHYQAISGALFTLPFFLFSATAGQLADKFDKATMAKFVKVFELGLMALGGYALYQGSIFLMLATLSGMGVHSTFFGPIKYAILPDHLPRKQLLGATALIEASTFIAILLGTTLGALAIGTQKSHVGYAIFITNLLAVLGLVASFFIPPAPSKINTLIIDWNIWRATKVMIKEAMGNASLYPAILAISWFWLIGAVMLTKLPDYTHFVLGANTEVFAIFLALFSIGIAIGAMAISYVLGGKITLRYVPLAMLLLSFFAFDLYSVSPDMKEEGPLLNLLEFLADFTNLRITLDFFLLSFCGGLFVVPLYTYLQICCAEGARARTIAVNNIINALFMVTGSILIMILLHFKVKIAAVFLILAILNTAGAFVLWFLFSRKVRKNVIESFYNQS